MYFKFRFDLSSFHFIISLSAFYFREVKRRRYCLLCIWWFQNPYIYDWQRSAGYDDGLGENPGEPPLVITLWWWRKTLSHQIPNLACNIMSFWNDRCAEVTKTKLLFDKKQCLWNLGTAEYQSILIFPPRCFTTLAVHPSQR